MTFSLLPDCLAAQMPGTLEQVQEAAEAVEQTARGEVTLEQAADKLRPPEEQRQAVELRSAVQWMKRRHRAVVRALTVLMMVQPELLPGSTTSTEAFAARLVRKTALVELRRAAADKLQQVPAPVGLAPRSGHQQSMRNRR